MLRSDPQKKHQLRGTLLKTSRGKMLVTYSILPMIGITFLVANVSPLLLVV